MYIYIIYNYSCIHTHIYIHIYIQSDPRYWQTNGHRQDDHVHGACAHLHGCWAHCYSSIRNQSCCRTHVH